jgi:predicted nucleotidyltransferase
LTGKIERELLGWDYTIDSDPLINRLIGFHVGLITRTLLEEINDVIAVFLVGSYARGEGRALALGGNVMPLGDFDFLIVSTLPHARTRFSLPPGVLSSFPFSNRVQVAIIWRPLLALVARRVFWYETKFGSKLILGARQVLDDIRIHSGRDIDFNESFTLLANRLATLERVFDPSFMQSKPTEEESKDLIAKSLKVILACGESLLIAKGRYHFKYREKCQRFLGMLNSDLLGLSRADQSLEEDFRKASDFRLKASFETHENAVQLYFTAKEHAWKCMRYLLQDVMHRTGSRSASLDLEDLTQILLRQRNYGPSRRLLDFATFNWNSVTHLRSFRGLRPRRQLFCDIISVGVFNLAFSSHNDGEIDSEALERAVKLIAKITPQQQREIIERNSFQGWRLARDLVLRAWELAAMVG